MRLTIFFRLFLGYLLIFILVLAISVYAILQLQQFETTTRSIQELDNQVLESEKRLSDSLLSQMRYERKYLVVRDRVLYDQYLLASDDFRKNMDQALLLAVAFPQREILDKVKTYYEEYQSLIAEEMKFVQANQRYNHAWYKQEKEKAVDQMLEALKKLAADSRQNTFDKIKKLGEVGAEARRGAIFMAIMALLGVLTISFFITRSITRPISVLIDKTREIAKGVFKCDLHLSSPPEIKELSQAVNFMCDQLRAMDQMKADFFSMISHEMRTPLTSIKVGTGMLLLGSEREITKEQKEILDIISRESQRLIDLVNSILDLSKMEAGMMVFHFNPTDIRLLINQTIAEIKPLALGANVRLHMESPQSLPLIRMDRERILQVLRNFMGNAVKFTPRGGQVIISAVSKEGMLEVCVKDTGPGIPKENLTIIFEKFQQAPLQRSNMMRGSGLGLAIAKHVITAHGGKVWAESEPGQGSSFFFILPA
ncbi:MAG: ATP-binding protein [Thermodesulfobacteriota bacterium]|nr:ATP-binding protein [Thermodesulfobacteriota bacterium]